MTITVTLTQRQTEWLETRVSDKASVEDAARRILDERMAEEDDDLAWAKAALEKADAEIAKGEVITLEEHEARNKVRFPALDR